MKSKGIKISGRRIKLVLAPMDGFTNITYRILCHKYGADMVCTEMVNADALSIKNLPTMEKAKTVSEERPVSLQLFGKDSKKIKKAAAIAGDFANVDVIDFNMGCPVKRVTSMGAGADLLNKPEKIKEIVEALVSSADKPVSVKIRAGHALRNAKIIEKAGASFIILHARTRKQKYSGRADWNLIKEVKSKVSIPVIGSGDIANELDVEKMLEICDSAMIGRAALGDPMIFKRCKYYLKNNEFLEISDEDKINAFFEYLELAEKFKVKFSAVKRMAVCFTKGLASAKKLRMEIIKCKDISEIKKKFKVKRN